MQYVPNWLHRQLLRFKWYRRKCGIVDMSPEMRAMVRELLHSSMHLLTDVGRNYDVAYKVEPGAMLKVRKPVSYTRRGG